MIKLEGRYNTAEIMIDEIDDTTREQIRCFLDHPAFGGTRIVIMPDCHAGKGAVIGFTMQQNDYIIPNVIGVDIGCGILSCSFGRAKIDLPGLDRFIRQNIPSGFEINRGISGVPAELRRDMELACGMIGIDPVKALRAAGSLGGGNHFIEAGYSSGGELYVTVHSGSRNFGKCVADFYQKRARENLKKSAGVAARKDLEYLEAGSADANDYLFCLYTAQRFAAANRREMMARISSFIRMEPSGTIESIHNYIDPADRIIRKGATPARKGQLLLIPFNMRDGIALCVGKGSAEFNFSAPHGAGRVLSRKGAKRVLSLDEFRSQMKGAGIYTTTVNSGTLDEAPAAYKSPETIIENIRGTVDVLDFIKPVYNFKAADD